MLTCCRSASSGYFRALSDDEVGTPVPMVDHALQMNFGPPRGPIGDMRARRAAFEETVARMEMENLARMEALEIHSPDLAE